MDRLSARSEISAREEPGERDHTRLRCRRAGTEAHRRGAERAARPSRRGRDPARQAQRQRTVRQLSVLPRHRQGHHLLLAPEAAHPGRRRLVVSVVGGDPGGLTARGTHRNALKK